MSNLLRPLFARRRNLGVAGCLLFLFGSLGCLGSAQLSAGVAYEEPVVYVEPVPVTYVTRAPTYYRTSNADVRVYRGHRPYGPPPAGRDAYRPRHRHQYPY
jgi:hypothetical protein